MYFNIQKIDEENVFNISYINIMYNNLIAQDIRLLFLSNFPMQLFYNYVGIIKAVLF